MIHFSVFSFHFTGKPTFHMRSIYHTAKLYIIAKLGFAALPYPSSDRFSVAKSAMTFFIVSRS